MFLSQCKKYLLVKVCFLVNLSESIVYNSIIHPLLKSLFSVSDVNRMIISTRTIEEEDLSTGFRTCCYEIVRLWSGLVFF